MRLAWGVTVQTDVYNSNRDNAGDNILNSSYEGEQYYFYTDSWSEEIDTMSFIIAVGPTIDVGWWKLYGGALYHLLIADYDEKYNYSYWAYDEVADVFSNKDETYQQSADFNQDNFGGYFGAQFDVADHNILVEFMGTQDSWSVGVGISILF